MELARATQFRVWALSPTQGRRGRRAVRWLGLVLLVLLPGVPALAQTETTTSQARRIIDYCLTNPSQCSLSIHHLTGGWERHLNPDRLNALASTWKVLPLIAYGVAVTEGELDPDRVIARDEWGRFFVGGDGGALETAWKRLGEPFHVTLDQMVGAMMRESDNATPDWLFNDLGERALVRTIEKYFTRQLGYHDRPKSIASIFLTWDDNPRDPVIGDRIASDYSDFGAHGYHRELDAWFGALLDPQFVDDVRAYRCAFLPWVRPPPCTPPTGGTAEVNLRRLQENHYMRSNTRTYTRVMHRLLERNLVPTAVQRAIEHSLEWRLETTGDRFRRYGAKSGTLGTLAGLTVINWTTYVETKAPAPGRKRGVRAAVTLHLRGDGGALPLELAFIRPSLAEALVEDPAFAEEVRRRIPAEVSRPSLVARVEEIRAAAHHGRHRLRVRVEVSNVGTVKTASRSAVAFYLSPNSQVDGARLLGRIPVKALEPGETDSGHLKVELGSTSPDGLFLITVVDPDNAVRKGDEAGHVQWERLRF
jgi:hypothetical protein